MAEWFLFSIAESLITKLASRAYEEASLVVGVYDDLRDIKETLSFVKAVLLDAEQKQEKNHELRVWLKQIKLVFSDAEDVLDELECETLPKHVVNAYGNAKAKVSRFFSSSNPLVFRHRMARQIKEIKKRLDKVAADRNKFGLETNDVDRRVVHRRDMTHSHVIASEVIGREHDKEKIINLLIPQQTGVDDQSLSIIPIVGIGGLGKTTLAKLVFNDKRIDESFPLKMWVCVSDDFDIKQVIIKILNSARVSASTPTLIHQENLNNLDVEQLQTHLRNILASKKFLLVLDDVWNQDRAKWVELRSLIQEDIEGSKILVTTRSHSIASMMGTIPSYDLQGLSLDDSMSLFVKWAFKEGEEKNYPNLVEVGKEIVKKCGGLPLAVRTLGSSLFSKVDISYWESVRDNEIWNVEQKKDDILPALKLSYDQMPSYLRQCFACFSLYPKDYSLTSFHVSMLWGALGLLPSPNKNKTLEDVANQYLNELLSISFLQDVVDLGTAYVFTIHDLVHDLALYVAKDEFLLVNPHRQNIFENVRHLSFVENDLNGRVSIPVGVRTILFPVAGVGANSEAFLNTWFSRYKYLRVLDLSNSTYETLPHSIGNLKHLRVLDVSENKKITMVPDSVCKLQNLQYFALYGCTKLERLPKGLRNLISLRQLAITTKESVLLEKEIAKLTSLQNLHIEACDNSEYLFKGIQLPTLKVLSVIACGSLKSLAFNTKQFPQLETLIIDECANLELSKGYEDQNLNLRLKCLYFVSLPQLVTLPQWLQGSANTLKSLIISNCINLKVLPEWLSNLTCLKTLHIKNCPKLLSLPNDIHHLTTLERLVIKDCPVLSRKCQPQVGEYWPKISHIKKIDIDEPREFEEEEGEVEFSGDIDEPREFEEEEGEVEFSGEKEEEEQEEEQEEDENFNDTENS